MLHTTPDDTFDIIMKIHVRAPFRLIRQAAPYFRLKVYQISQYTSPQLTNQSSPSNEKIVRLLMFPRLQVSTEMSDKQIMLQPKLLYSG